MEEMPPPPVTVKSAATQTDSVQVPRVDITPAGREAGSDDRAFEEKRPPISRSERNAAPEDVSARLLRLQSLTESLLDD